MYSKSIPASTITTTLLNSATGYTADASLSVSKTIENGIVSTNPAIALLPKGVQLINKSGTDLEWLVLSTQDEVDMYTSIASYPYFAFTLLPNNAALFNSNLPRCKQFIVRAVGGVGATSGVRIDFFGYFS